MQQQCVLTEKEKLAAVDNAVPTTLPLSLIPSTNKYIMDALTPIIHKKHTPRARIGDSGASNSFAMHDAVAASAPLTIACLLNVIQWAGEHFIFLDRVFDHPSPRQK